MSVAKTGNISPIDRAAAEPFYRQIYDRFRGAIASGVLKPGDRIPSARALTKELGLARGTIESAYSLLAAGGDPPGRGQGRPRRDAKPKAASACFTHATAIQRRNLCAQFPSRHDFAVPDG